MTESVGVRLAKKAYVKGNIDLETLEKALEDRLKGNRYSHDERIDGYIPSSVRGENYQRYAY